jgi:hypothetical protein
MATTQRTLPTNELVDRAPQMERRLRCCDGMRDYYFACPFCWTKYIPKGCYLSRPAGSVIYEEDDSECDMVVPTLLGLGGLEFPWIEEELVVGHPSVSTEQPVPASAAGTKPCQPELAAGTGMYANSTRRVSVDHCAVSGCVDNTLAGGPPLANERAVDPPAVAVPDGITIMVNTQGDDGSEASANVPDESWFPVGGSTRSSVRIVEDMLALWKLFRVDQILRLVSRFTSSPLFIIIVTVAFGVESIVRLVHWVYVPLWCLRTLISQVLLTAGFAYLGWRLIYAGYIMTRYSEVVVRYNDAVYRVRGELEIADNIVEVGPSELAYPGEDNCDAPVSAGVNVEQPDSAVSPPGNGDAKTATFTNRRHAWGKRKEMSELRAHLTTTFPYWNYAMLLIGARRQTSMLLRLSWSVALSPR